MSEEQGKRQRFRCRKRAPSQRDRDESAASLLSRRGKTPAPVLSWLRGVPHSSPKPASSLTEGRHVRSFRASVIHENHRQEHNRKLFEAPSAVKHQFIGGPRGGIVSLAKWVAACIANVRMHLLGGNGGSAGDARHLAAMRSLAAPRASFIIGAVLVADGGQCRSHA